MRNLKKLVALIVTIALMAAFAIPAFAAAPPDVKGTDYEGAVTRLVALGVITGYPNGDFGPNDSITRAQFAAVVVRALGYEEVAVASKGTTKFTDVSASHWASGYINLAVSLGVIKGNPDGTFAPDTPVLYEQAVTMIVRALGQDYFAENKGGYPSGYMVQAKLIGFTDGVKGVSGVAAARGIVAQLIDNAKDTEIYEQTGFGDSPKYEPKEDDTFLNRLGITRQADDVIVTQTPDSNGLDAGTFKAGTDGTTYTIVEGTVNIESLLGKQVDLWGEDADHIVLAENITGTAVSVTDVVYYNAATNVLKVDLSDGTDDEEYTIIAGAGIYKDLKLVTGNSAIDDAMEALLAASDSSADKIKVDMVINDDEILYVNGIEFTKAVQLDSDPVENTVSDFIRIFTGFYIKYADTDAAKVVIEKDGQIVDWKALKDNDVLFISGQGDKTDIDEDYIYIKASSKTATGTLEAAKSDSSAASSVKIEGTWYDLSTFASADTKNVAGDLGDEVTVYLDAAGKVFAIGNDTGDVSTDKYGIIVGNEVNQSLGDTVYKVKVLTSTGDKIVYTLADDDDNDDFMALFDEDNANNLKGTLVSYHIAADGNIDMIEANATAGGAAGTFDTSRKIFKGQEVSDNVVIFENGDGDDYSKITLADIEDDVVNGTEAISFIEDDDVIVAMLLETYTAAESDAAYAYVSDYVVTSDGYTVDVITVDGAKSYAIDGDEDYTPGKGDLISFALNSGNEMIDIEEVDITAEGTVTELASNKIKLDVDPDADDETIETYFYGDSVLYAYDDDGDGGAEAIAKDELYADMEVQVYEVDDEVVAVIVTEN